MKLFVTNVLNDFERSRWHCDEEPLLEVALSWFEGEGANARIEELARSVGLSQSALERRFRRQLGLSPKRFASLARLGKAVRLRAQGLQYAQAALQAGYYDQAHFINAFKRVMGCSPSRYFRRFPENRLIKLDLKQTFVLIACMNQPIPNSTADRILDAAERLFAERDYDSVSTRDIVRAASANIAAVNYHFGGKEELYRAVFFRRLGPANRNRMERLESEEREAGKHPVPVRRLLEIFLAPIVEVAGASKDGAAAFLQLMARTIMMPHPIIAAQIEQEFTPIRQRFLGAFTRSLPHLTADRIESRFRCVLGATLASFGTLPGRIGRHWGGLNAAERQAQLNELLAFLEAGLSAP